MGFFHSLLIRITLAILGGILYALLTYALILSLNLSSSLALLAASLVYLLYLGSRLLLLFSGIDSPYYPRERKGPSRPPLAKNSFQEAARWWGNFITSMTWFFSFSWGSYLLPSLSPLSWMG
jgi:hypothetical protein